MIRLFNYNVSLRQLSAIESGILSFHRFDAAVENEMTGEQSRWAVLVSHRERAEVRGWVVAAAEFGRKLSGGVEPEIWMEHPAAQSLTLMDIFPTSKEHMADYIHQNIFKDTYTRHSAWMQKNEQELDFLSRLNYPMPPYCLAPLAFVYHQQWNNLVRQLEHRGDEEEVATKLRDLAKMREQFKISFDIRESAALLERIIIKELAALAVKLSAETCRRIEYLLNIVDRFAIPVSKHTMEDMFAPIAAGPVRSLHDEVAAAGNEQSDRRALLAALVNFAHRMNFNTDAFRLP